MRLVQASVLLVDAPEQLGRAACARSVRRYLTQRVAPGIALVRPEDRAPLLRALDRQGIACTVEATREDGMATRTNADERGLEASAHVRSRSLASHQGVGKPAPSPNLSSRERAALLLACAHYRHHAPSRAPLLPHADLEARLRAGLSAALQSAVDAALADMRPPPTPVALPAEAPLPRARI